MQASRLNRFTQYLLARRAQALAITFVSAFIPIAGLLSILIAALITLTKGMREGAIFTLAASLPFLVGVFFDHQQTVPLAYWAAIGVAVLSNILTWVFAVFLYRNTPWSVIIQVAALLGVLTISVLHLVFPDMTSWWQTQLQFYYEHSLTNAKILKVPSVNAGEGQLEIIQLTKHYATGLMIAAILFNALFQLAVARWWQFYVQNDSLKKELHYIRLSRLASVLFVFSLWLSYLRNNVVLDMMPILYLLFTVAGLSLIHYLFGLMKSPSRWFWMWVLYLTLFFTIPMSMMLVSMLALFDAWLDIRKRIIKV